MNPMLLFTSTPIHRVFEEIEKQYGIEIEVSEELSHLYSGKFSMDVPLENVLTLLCRPFNLRYDRITDKKYIVYPASDH